MKRVVVAYLNNGNVKSQIAKGLMFEKVVDDLVAEGKMIRSVEPSPMLGVAKMASFEDGTKVFLQPFGQSILGMKFTHIYIDELAMQFPNSKEMVSKMYSQCIIDKSDDKMFTFLFDKGYLKTKKV